MNTANARTPLYTGPLPVVAVAGDAHPDVASPPPSPPRLGTRLSSSTTSYAASEPEPLALEEVAALMTRGGGAASASKDPTAKEAKPKLTVSASGRFQDQFYHTQEASRAMGIFKNRAIVKQTNEGQRSDAAVKRRKSLNVNGRDVEQFSDADIIFSGYLVKQGSFWKTWRRRYFILRRDVNVLAYYTSQENLVKLGEITIDGDTTVIPPNPKETQFPGKFTVEHQGRKLVLVAEDGRASAETWTMLIERCVNTRAAEAEAAMNRTSRGSSQRESIRSSLMQLRLSGNDSQIASARSSLSESFAEDSPGSQTKQPPKLPPRSLSSDSKMKGPRLEAVEVATMPTQSSPPPSEPLSKIKRHSTDSRVIQAAAEESAHNRDTEFMDDEERERVVRNARLKSIDSANDEARKVLAATRSSGSSKLSVPQPRRLFRSYSAGSVLSTRSTAYDEARKLHDDCGLLAPRMPSKSSFPNSDKHLRNSLAGGGDDISSSSDTRARNLSLSSFRPSPSIELSVSIGCRGSQDISHMVVVLTAITLENRGESKELGRTEVQGALSLRACGDNFFARDFSALLPVSISGGRNLMLQFEIFSVISLSSEVVTPQQSLGFVRIPHVDLLFSGDSTLVLECLRSKVSPSKQTYFLLIDRIRPSESLNLGHSYTYAKRHFIADIVPFDLRTETSADMFAPSASPTDKPVSGNRSSFEVVAPTSAPSGVGEKSLPSGRAYGGMVRGNGDSSDATQVFISEELSSSYCSISVAATYMTLVQRRNQRRIQDAKLFINDIERKYEQIPSSPNSRTESSETINAHMEMIRDAENRVEHYRKLYDSYDECEDYYHKLLAMLENGLEPGITGCLKRSTMKKDKRSEFMATNLNSHIVRARRVALSSPQITVKDQGSREKPVGASGDELVYAVVTHGCPAAHTMGFKEGGLRRLRQSLAHSKDKDDMRLQERIEQRQDIVRCQILAIVSASFLTVIGLAANQSARHQERLQLMCQTGFLVSMESLLSTIKNEKGMIEDMYDGVQWLNSAVSLQVVQSLEENPKLKCAKCVAITSADNGTNVVATFALPSDVFSTLPDVLRHGHALKVHGLMFTQGINEMQSVANHVLDTSLQDEINLESATRLVRYFEVYKTHVLAMQPPNPDRIKDLPDLEIEIKILAEKLNQSRKSNVQKKNVNILIESSDLCRRLGAGRTTCCKSGKDRTAMSVTLECSRLLVDKFHVKQGVHLCNAMRERGVRRVNVLANTGKNKFAFNSFQLKYLPDCYRPPALAADSKVQS